jgi:NADH-quinone oxidoreductase subunit N
LNAPLVWIVFPILAAIIMIALRRWRTAINILGTGISFFLAVMALVIPVSQELEKGLIQFALPGEWTILGRILMISQVEMPFISFLYFMSAVWFLLSWQNNPRSLFIPFGLGVIALLIAALAVRPFIYAALLIEAAVLGCVLMLTERPIQVGMGAIRFLILQSLGMPFILLAGWFLASGEITPINQTQLTLSVVLLVLGFAFWLGMFPLHTWIPMIAGDGEPRVSGFIFSILPLPVLFFLLSFMNSYAWLREYPLLFPVLRWLGAFMVLFGGLWTFFQKDLRQIYGYLIIAMNGLALLAIGIKGSSGISLFTYFFLPRFLSIFLFSISITIFQKNNRSMDVEDLPGLVGQLPFSTLALAVAIFSVAGLPLLPGFPLIQIMEWELVNLSFLSVVMLLAGMFFLFLACLRLVSISFTKTAGMPRMEESAVTRWFITAVVVLMIVIGLLPAVVNSLFLSLAARFPQLLR